ncbi:putative gustatory receptor 97a [Lucilia sericata]|uniref:putative gustatory receptor 97a n=1 Tax=Lucilia sericata TaxID=13632 RepID=UPI0018A81F1E|nr:putative gustatory receptor 97a [Lucilia sericata]
MFIEIVSSAEIRNTKKTSYFEFKVKETGLILKRIRLDHADVRFRQSVEQFSFEILVIDFKIQPMRLLNIDLGLLHDVLSAVTSFLLILIQSDLTLRFSLK